MLTFWPRCIYCDSLTNCRRELNFFEGTKCGYLYNLSPCSILLVSSIESVKDMVCCGLLQMSWFHVFINLTSMVGWEQHWYFKFDKACGITGNIHVFKAVTTISISCVLSCFNPLCSCCCALYASPAGLSTAPKHNNRFLHLILDLSVYKLFAYWVDLLHVVWWVVLTLSGSAQTGNATDSHDQWWMCGPAHGNNITRQIEFHVCVGLTTLFWYLLCLFQ